MNDIQRVERSMYRLGTAYEPLERLMFETTDMETGEVDTEITNALCAMQGEATEVAVGAATIYREAQMEIAKYKAEEERLAAIRKGMESKLQTLKRAIDIFCKRTGIERAEGVSARIAYKKNPPSVVIDNEAEIPKEFWRCKLEVNKSAIKEALAAGKPVAGAHLESAVGLQIK